MKGKQNDQESLTPELKTERLHFLFRGTGYILLYGSVLIFIASLIIVIFPKAELEGPWAIVGFVIFIVWLIIAFFCILYGKYNQNVFTKLFWVKLFNKTKAEERLAEKKVEKLYKETKIKVSDSKKDKNKDNKK